MDLPVLNATELRVIGSLMEKCMTTPDYYPMTINGLVAACNQKTSRNPVVQYDDDTVIQTLNDLKKRGLISTATGGSSRVIKYKHNFAIVFPVIPAEVSLLCLLILRGPQTPGELNTNSGRMYEFESIEEVIATLEKLAADEPPYVTQLPKKPGQKEQRYSHLFAGMPDLNENDDDEEVFKSSAGGLAERVTKLEKELTELKDAFDKLMKELS